MEENEIRKNFSKNIQELRKSHKLSQNELSQELSYTDKAISKWENGETMPDIFTLNKVASYFHITVDELISDKNVTKASFTTQNHLRITAVSAGLSLLVGSIVYFFLSIFGIEKTMLALIGSFIALSIVLIVFTAMWFKKIYLFIAISMLIWSVAILLVEIFNFYDFIWLVAVIAVITNVLFAIFMGIKK